MRLDSGWPAGYGHPFRSGHQARSEPQGGDGSTGPSSKAVSLQPIELLRDFMGSSAYFQGELVHPTNRQAAGWPGDIYRSDQLLAPSKNWRGHGADPGKSLIESYDVPLVSY